MIILLTAHRFVTMARIYSKKMKMCSKKTKNAQKCVFNNQMRPSRELWHPQTKDFSLLL